MATFIIIFERPYGAMFFHFFPESAYFFFVVFLVISCDVFSFFPESNLLLVQNIGVEKQQKKPEDDVSLICCMIFKCMSPEFTIFSHFGLRDSGPVFKSLLGSHIPAHIFFIRVSVFCIALAWAPVYSAIFESLGENVLMDCGCVGVSA